MRKGTIILIASVVFCGGIYAADEIAEKVVDIPTRQHVTERLLVLAPKNPPKAAVILLAGGHGGLQISEDGSFAWGKGNFLVRSRRLFADQSLLTIVVDAPSDRLRPPYLSGFRGTSKHVMDLKAVIAWVRKQANVPIWLVGTSRGTESAAYTATYLSGRDGPDGLVLTSTILSDNKEFPVTSLQLDRVQIPVLIVHHLDDGCRHCSYAGVSRLMDALINAPKKELIPVQGGVSQGDPCEAWSHHGFNGVESEVVGKIVAWVVQK
jgi:hypothetical protein